MATKFSPSINIVRDAGKEFDYLPTPNSRRIFQQIVNDYKIGIRSFNIIGSYGTGKSAFLLALEKNLRGERHDFESPNGHLGNAKTFEFWNIVGEYTSLLSSVARSLQVDPRLATSQTVWKAIHTYYENIQRKNACLVIVIDEFGKFLEYAATHTPEKELYFVQQLAEFANDESKNIVLLTTLHQGFDAYARGLEQAQRQEWEKVKGRLKELTFNEPVEMLLNLAAEHLEATRTGKHTAQHVETLVTLINTSHTFPHRTPLTHDFAQKLHPFDPLTGAVLTLALQRYGQNERSLFTFLRSNDRFGLKDYDADENPYYNLACLYDYLLHNYYSFLSTKYNPHYANWASIRRALDRVEWKFETTIEHASQLVKTIGLLNIFTSEQASIDQGFLGDYARLCLGIEDARGLLKALEDKKIIRYRAFKQRFVLFEGTDLDFDLALLDAAARVDTVKDVVIPLKKHFDFPYILAKAISYQTGTPRFFQFQLSETPMTTAPQGEIDGIINLVFSENLDIEEVKQLSQQGEQAILYGVYQNTKQIKSMLFEIAKTEHVIDKNYDDRVAVEELKELREHQREELNHDVLHCLHGHSDEVVWIFAGQVLQIQSLSAFNAELSAICERVYPGTPEFRNELINRHKLSAAISTARRKYLRALTERWHEDDLGFSKKQFPAEKTIYLTLLHRPGIHRHENGGYMLAEPLEPTFKPLWRICEEFLSSAKLSRKNLDELVNILSEKPLKLKRGFIDVWLPTFLFIRREAFALYQEDYYVPEISHEVLELLVKKPQKFQLKTFDVQGVKLDLFQRYRALVQQSEGQVFTNTSFIETVKPFLTFYHSLPAYTKQTSRLDQNALKLRDVIATATDPEKTFFEDFPRALGYGFIDVKEFDDEQLKAYIFQLRHSIKHLQTCFRELVDRIEAHLLKLLGYEDLTFPAYRERIQQRFESVKTHTLLPHLKGAYHRLISDFGDRDAWIGSIVQAVLHKKLPDLQDEEEELLRERISQTIQELDNLCEIAKMIADPEKEKVFKVEVTSYADGSQEQLVRVPKQTEQEEQALEEELQTTLSRSTDRRVRISLLVKLLQQELHNG